MNRELTGKKDTELTKVIGRNLKDVEYTGKSSKRSIGISGSGQF